MHLGLPLDLTWYRLLTDWGGLIGGVSALIAGIAAYLAGLTQAATTQQAAEMQVIAMQRATEQQVATANAELEHLKAEKAEEDRRAREELLAALDMEAANIAMQSDLKITAARRRHTGTTSQGAAQVELYKISAGRVFVEARGIPTLVHVKIRRAIINLLGGLDQLNALIDTRGLLLSDLGGSELIKALERVSTRAADLQGALGEYGGDRRII